MKWSLYIFWLPMNGVKSSIDIGIFPFKPSSELLGYPHWSKPPYPPWKHHSFGVLPRSWAMQCPIPGRTGTEFSWWRRPVGGWRIWATRQVGKLAEVEPWGKPVDLGRFPIDPKVWLSSIGSAWGYLREKIDLSDLNDFVQISKWKHRKTCLATTNIFPDHCNPPFHFWLLDIPIMIIVYPLRCQILISIHEPCPSYWSVAHATLQLQKTCQSSLRNLTKMATAIWKWKSSVQLGIQFSEETWSKMGIDNMIQHERATLYNLYTNIGIQNQRPPSGSQFGQFWSIPLCISGCFKSTLWTSQNWSL